MAAGHASRYKTGLRSEPNRYRYMVRTYSTHSHAYVRLTLVRRPAVAATGRCLHLYHYGRRLSSSAHDAAAVPLLPMRPIGGACMRWRV